MIGKIEKVLATCVDCEVLLANIAVLRSVHRTRTSAWPSYVKASYACTLEQFGLLYLFNYPAILCPFSAPHILNIPPFIQLLTQINCNASVSGNTFLKLLPL